MFWVLFTDDPKFYHGPFRTDWEAVDFAKDIAEYEEDHGYDVDFSVIESDGRPIVH